MRGAALTVLLGALSTVSPCLAWAAEAPPPSATARSGERVYREVCGYCHGRNVGPIVLGRTLDVATTRTMVREGLNAMPAFRPSEVDESELAALAQFIATSAEDPTEHGE